MQQTSKKIAKNTLFLYFRLLITLLISLYTSRVVLQTLGITDYGIYGIVGDIVGFMGFLNAALASSSSRFLTYALGEDDKGKSQRTFSTTLTIHIVLGILIVLIAESIGPWMIHHKLNIPPDRLDAALWAFHFSVITIAIGVSQVPYSATLIANEKMDIFAYVSIVDAFLRLITAFLIQYFGSDKLVFFALLILLQNAGMMLFYRLYCSRKFDEAKFRLSIDKTIFKAIAKFSGLSLISNLASTFNSQGTTILMGMFFNPTIIAAKAISVKVNMMTTQFIGNFRQAMNPQIVKNHAAKDYKNFSKLVYNSGLYSFYIMWVMTLPICLLAEPLLKLWLGVVPDYTVIFVQLIMIDSLFWLYDCSFNDGIVANGDLKLSTIYTSILQIIRFLLIYLFFKLGYSPTTAFIIGIIFGIIIGLVLKPYLLHKLMMFKWRDFINIYLISLKVVAVSIIIPLALLYFVDENSIEGFISIGFVSVLSALFTIFYIGLDKTLRNNIRIFALRKLKNIRKQ